MGPKWTAFLLVALLGCMNCLDWQGAGNWTLDNITQIRKFIFDLNPSQPSYTYAPVAEGYSYYFNDLWSPAWNVFFVHSKGNNYDSVLYGYGFNGHWFWFNGFKVDTGYVAFIIWKDYNCIKWYTYNAYFNPTLSTYSSQLTNLISNTLKSGAGSRNLDDIWKLAQSVQAAFPKSDAANLIQDETAYTVIASQETSDYYGRFCAKDYFFMNGPALKGTQADGSVMVMQMR